MNLDDIWHALGGLVDTGTPPTGATPPGQNPGATPSQQQPMVSSAPQVYRGRAQVVSAPQVAPVPGGANPNVEDDYLSRLVNPPQDAAPPMEQPTGPVQSTGDFPTEPIVLRSAVQQNLKHYRPVEVLNQLALDRPALRPYIQDALSKGYNAKEVLDFYTTPQAEHTDASPSKAGWFPDQFETGAEMLYDRDKFP